MTFIAQPHAKLASHVGKLIAMLETMRPHNSTGEGEFIRRFIDPLDVESDSFGNRYKIIGQDPTILWSSHVDSCHRKPGRQRIAIDAGIVRTDDPAANCLGADCAAGVWLMTEMIAAGIPGLYLFHRGEERGGLGSSHIARNEPALLKGINAAIAFDRRGTTSIITHQRGERACSEAFAQSLSAAIGLGQTPDPTGTFTDTANYTDLIGECTNVSVGYDHEHTAHETLDLPYLLKLRNAMLSFDASTLVFKRKPGELDASAFDPFDYWHMPTPRFGKTTLADLVSDYPEIAADLLEQCGITEEDFGAYFNDCGLL